MTGQYDEIRRELEANREEAYAGFAASLLPGESRLIGVRLPVLRKLARKLARGDWREYLRGAPDHSFEEIMLQGMVIGYVQAAPADVFPYITAFVPKITNWSLCDSFCIGLKAAKAYPQEFWSFLLPYLHSENEFQVRFAVVMLLNYFIDIRLPECLRLLDGVRHEGYYVKMAVAWALSMCYVLDRATTLEYLCSNHLDDFTYNKTLQKITESRQVSEWEKEKIRFLKRGEASKC